MFGRYHGDGDSLAIYHPALGFLEDTCAGGAWTEDRSRASAFKTYGEALAALGACLGNGMTREVAIECQILRWR